MRVLIVGCGYVGLKLGLDLVERGHSVWGLRRSDRADATLKRTGISPIRADITRPESLPALDRGYDWVVLCVSATGGDAAGYEQVYNWGTRNVLNWLSARPPTKLVYTSSTGVYGQTDGSWVDEASATVPQAAIGQLLVRAEKLLLEAAANIGFCVVVLRAAGIYGPGRSYWLDQFRSGQVRLDGSGDRILNMVHRDDLAMSMFAGLDQASNGGIYNVVDDQPITQLLFFQWLSQRLDYPMPPAGNVRELPSKRGVTNKRVSNHKLKTDLGYRFQFPSFKEGYEAILSSKEI